MQSYICSLLVFCVGEIIKVIVIQKYTCQIRSLQFLKTNNQYLNFFLEQLVVTKHLDWTRGFLLSADI